MTAAGWLPADAEELFGAGATAEESYDVLTVDVPPAAWITALETARDRLGCTFFDWLSAVDEPGTGLRVAAHVAALAPVRRLLVRTTVPHETPVLPTAVPVYAGAAWHERETHEMFGVVFEGHPALDHLLLPENFEGHPLRKDFVLAARVAKAWPGAKEPGESDHGGPRRRQMLPPGVPDPNEWGPLKGRLPAAPARGAARAAGDRPARAAGERPPRRMRTASQGSVGQTAPGAEAPAAEAPSPATETPSPATEAPAAGPAPAAPAARPRRARSASEGSASQRTGAAAPEAPSAAPGGEGRTAATGSRGPATRRTRSASEGSASQRTGSTADRPGGTGTTGAAGPSGATGETPAAPKPPSPAPRSSDAPWHHARPAFDEPPADAGKPEAPEVSEAPEKSGSQGSTKTEKASESPEAGEAGEAPEAPEADGRPPARTDTPDDHPGGTQ
ncbi:NADH-quinone oxidoreductase subunit C [Streptomyces sp. NPDC006367]|uniref:NADH-quinone oxidoreductase subunit C n=1 Tax=unclassified Streptomyces TaxID=2593676 RepID=UPI00339F62C9